MNRLASILLAISLSPALFAAGEADHCPAGVLARIGPGLTQPVGSSDALKKLLAEVDRVAPVDLPVLILGETGSGKELVAQRLFQKGKKTEKLLSINMAAVPETLAESTFFGHEKGAFTGASVQQKGIFEQAEGGTVFLDEFGEASLETQARLLRVLDGHDFTRVGGHTPIKPNVRVVVATNRDLVAEVKAGRFRNDLYYRISAITLRIPPLRERLEDIPELTAYIMRTLNSREPTMLRATGISEEALAKLATFLWPGNIRELENVLTRAMFNCEGETIQLADLPNPDPRFGVPGVLPLGPPGSIAVPAHIISWLQQPGRLSDGTDAVEAHAIMHLLRHYEGNYGRIAEHLGISRATLRARMLRHELDYRHGQVVTGPQKNDPSTDGH